jgi:ATP-binding protein involved in chromosome partitioning
VLGIIENMSSYVCPQCGHREAIFKEGGGRRTAQELGVPFLGEVPIDPAVVVSGDDGTPIVASRPDSPAALAFAELARAVALAVAG